MSEQCAYHEAGHAVVAHQLGASVELISISPEWDPSEPRDGDIEIHWPLDRISGKQLTVASIRTALAGPAAEMIYTKDPFHPAMVRAWRADWNTAWKLGAKIHPVEKQRMVFLEQMTVEAHRFLSQDVVWQAVAALVDELLAHEFLESQDIQHILSTWL